MVKNNDTIDIAKKVLQKAIVNELYKNGVIEFAVCSNVIKKIEIEIEKLKPKNENQKKIEPFIIKIPIQ